MAEESEKPKAPPVNPDVIRYRVVEVDVTTTPEEVENQLNAQGAIGYRLVFMVGSPNISKVYAFFSAQVA